MIPEPHDGQIELTDFGVKNRKGKGRLAEETHTVSLTIVLNNTLIDFPL